MRVGGYAKDRRGVYIGYISYQHNVHKFLTCRYESICDINVGDCLALSYGITIFV